MNDWSIEETFFFGVAGLALVLLLAVWTIERCARAWYQRWGYRDLAHRRRRPWYVHLADKWEAKRLP